MGEPASRQAWARRVGGDPARAAQDDGGQIVEKGTRCRRTCESHFRNCVINLEESTGAPSITMAGACCIRSWFLLNVLVIIALRSAEHTSELQSLMRLSYAVVGLKQTPN